MVTETQNTQENIQVNRQEKTTPNARVAIVMGSQSDWETLEISKDVLEDLGVETDVRIISAHRTPERMVEFANNVSSEGIQVVIAGAGGAAHLPGMIASMTTLPVLGVPIQSKALNGLDSLLSIVQMPGGIPVGALAIGQAGAKNAGLLAASIIALSDNAVAEKLTKFRAEQTSSIAQRPEGV